MKNEVGMVSEMIECARQRFNQYRDRVIRPIIEKGLRNGRLYPEDIQKLAEYMAESEKFNNWMAQSAKLSAINNEVYAIEGKKINKELNELLKLLA